MSNAVPPWKQTRETILSQGVPTDKLDAAVAKYRQSFGAAVRTDDFLYYLVAKQEYGIDMPKLDTSTQKKGKGRRDDGEERTTRVVTATEVTHEFASTAGNSNFSTRGWVIDPRRGETKSSGKQKVTAVLIDETGQTQLNAFGDENAERWFEVIGDTYPAFVQFDGVQAFALGRDGATLTFGKYTRVQTVAAEQAPYPLASVLPDAAEASVVDRQVARISGVVVEERRNSYQACTNCRRSMKKARVCANCGGTDATTAEMHNIVLMDGATRHTLVLGADLAPRRDLYGIPVEAIGRYKADPGEFVAVSYKASGEAKFRPPAETFSNKRVGLLPKSAEVLNRYVRVYRKQNRAIVIGALKETGLNADQALEELEKAQTQGLIALDGDLVKWLGETKAENEAQAAVKAEGATNVKASAPAPKEADKNATKAILRSIRAGGEKGVAWDTIVAKGAESGLDENTVNEVIESLLASGEIFEPFLGTLRVPSKAPAE
jgi:hypothetical protein